MTISSTADFESLQTLIEQEGVDAALELLEKIFRRDKKYHELFEVLKMKLRHKLGVPLLDSDLGNQWDRGDPSDAQQREQYEDGLVEACRDVGLALLGAGQIREAWMYLRPVSD